MILTSALLVTPAAAASLLTRNLPRMMVLSCFFAVWSRFIGLYASYYANVSSGAAIVLTGTAWFAIALLLNYLLRLNKVRR